MKIIQFLMISSAVSLLLFASRSWAYPEFIGYGYTSCLTCHENGLGGGPLSDYGRALWSTEIASRAFYPSSMTDEEIGEQSGFLGSVPLPELIRPYIKYRGLNYEINPGPGVKPRFLEMQEDFGSTFHFDNAGKYTASITMGHVVRPEDYGLGKEGFERFVPREYFLKVELIKTWWLYAGLMEKAYGIRNVDHTSLQRTYQGFNEQPNAPSGMSDVQALTLHKVEEHWEVAAQTFFGNPEQDAQHKETGGAATGEYEIGEKKRLGASVLTSKSQLLSKQMAAVHYRQGLSKGSALLFEYGLIQDRPDGQRASVGSYNFVEGFVSMFRGYNFHVIVERYNQQFSATSPDQWKWEMGFLVFPLPRFELRLDLANFRQFSSGTTHPDTWELLEQIHISL